MRTVIERLAGAAVVIALVLGLGLVGRPAKTLYDMKCNEIPASYRVPVHNAAGEGDWVLASDYCANHYLAWRGRLERDRWQ